MVVYPWPFAVLGFFMAVVAIVGNGTVIFLVTTKQRLRTTANWFILSLALADFGLGVLFFPGYFICDVREMCLNSGAKFFSSFAHLFFFASMVNLWVMTFDRYLAIVKPLRYIALMTTRRVIAILATAWILVILLRITICIIFHAMEKNITALLVFRGILFAMLLLCSLFLVIAAGHILYINWKHSRQIATLVAQLNFNQPEAAPAITVNTSTQESSSAKLITIVVAVNLSCIITHIVAIWCVKVKLCTPSMSLNLAAVLLTMANAALNPVVYALLKRDIKKELKRMFARSVDVSA